MVLRSLKGETSAAEKRILLAWREASPDHERRYQEIAAVAALTAQDETAKLPSVPPPITNLIRIAETTRPQPLRPARRAVIRWVVTGTIAASITVGLGIALRAGRRSASQFMPEQVVTGPAEATTVSFPDGSVVRLAPNSRLRATPGRSRDLVLEGRAFFAVATDRERPFRVRTQAGDAVVLGTQFELSVDQRSARLIVLEGQVALGDGAQRVRVKEGELSRIVDGTTTPPVKVPDPHRMLEWIGRFLFFRDTPLGEVIREIERQYGARIQLRDTALARQTITGWYADKSFEDVVRIVCGVLDRSCTIDAAAAVIGGPAGQPLR